MTDSTRLHRLHFDPQGAVLASARECEAEVFLRWYGNTREQLAQEYSRYDAHSTFLALADPDGQVLAAARLISPGPAGLKTLDDISSAPWGVDGRRVSHAARMDLNTTWDVATIGVRRGAPGGGVASALALYHGLVLVGRANNVSGFVAILDEKVRRLLNAVGLQFHPLPGTATGPYLGSTASTPVYAAYGPLLDTQRRTAPDAHRLITLGIGLDGVSVPGLEHFALATARAAGTSTSDAA